MESPSVPEKPSSDAVRPTPVRPPGIEFAIGLALFGIVFILFSQVQTAVFIANVLERSPEFAGRGFSFGLLTDPLFQERIMEFSANGDVVSRVALWSGLAGLAAVLLSVSLWKRGRASLFLGLHGAAPRQFLKWAGIFLLLVLAIEGLAFLSPAFRTDFMKDMLASTSDMLWLVLGVGIMASLFEEFLLRGLLLGSLRHLLDEHASVALTAGLFAIMHLQYEWTVVLLILPMGVVLGYARTRSGSIWVPVLLHTLNNLATVFFGGG